MNAMNDADTGGIIVTKGSYFDFHMIIVPPLHLDDLRAKSGSCMSGELRKEQYCPWNNEFSKAMSQLKIFGSLRNIKAGSYFVIK